MSLHLQPVQLASGCNDGESHLVFADGLLVAVLVRLSDLHEEESGKWFLEAGFGPIWGRGHPSFASLDAAQAWITNRLETGPFR